MCVCLVWAWAWDWVELGRAELEILPNQLSCSGRRELYLPPLSLLSNLFWQVSSALFNPSSDDARRGQRDALRSPTTLREVQRRRGRGGPLGRVMGLGRFLRVYDDTYYVQGKEKASLAVYRGGR